MIKEAWSTPADYDIYFYVMIGLSYAATIIPSFAAMPVIGVIRFSMTCYLAYLALMSFLDLDKKPKAEKNIWNINNWLLYALRRPIVEWFIGYITPAC